MRKALTLLTLLALLVAPAVAGAQSSPFPETRTVRMQNAATATGNGTSLDTGKMSATSFQVSGTFVATVAFEGSLDNSNWDALTCYGLDSASPVSSVAATGLWKCNVSGLPLVRARVSAYTSGSVTVYGHATSASTALRDTTGQAPNSYVQTLNPTAMAALTGNITASSAAQTFTITGLQLGQTVFVNGPAPTALCPPTHERVSAANTLSVTFLQLTSAVCTPATGTYRVVAAAPGVQVGKVYVQTFNPTQMAALVGGITTTSVEQSFTVTGLTTADRVFVNGPAPTALCPPGHWRVSSGNTLTGNFVQLTSAVCTPATGTYQVVAM